LNAQVIKVGNSKEHVQYLVLLIFPFFERICFFLSLKSFLKCESKQKIILKVRALHTTEPLIQINRHSLVLRNAANQISSTLSVPLLSVLNTFCGIKHSLRSTSDMYFHGLAVRPLQIFIFLRSVVLYWLRNERNGKRFSHTQLGVWAQDTFSCQQQKHIWIKN